MRGSLGEEGPDYFAKLLLVLEHPKGAIGEGLQIEGRIALEGLRADLRRAYLFDHVKAERTAPRLCRPGNQVLAQSGEEAVWGEAPGSWRRFAAGLVLGLEDPAG